MLQQRSKILHATTKTVTCHSQINKYLKRKKKKLKNNAYAICGLCSRWQCFKTLHLQIRTIKSLIRLFILYIDEALQDSHALIVTFITSWENAKKQ